MERLDQMTGLLADELEKVLLKRQNQLIDMALAHKQQLLEAIAKLTSGQQQEKSLMLVITWLRSSFVTGTHDFRIAVYEEEPFINEHPDEMVYSLKDIFDFEKEDIAKFMSILQGKIFHITKSEIEELRRYYMELLYKSCKMVFEMMVPERETDEKMQIFYGEEMGELELIGMY